MTRCQEFSRAPKLGILLFWILLLIWGGGGNILRVVQAAETESLYERLGGYDGISRIVDGFLVKMWSDPLVGRFFVGMGTDTREQLRQKNILLLCKNTGGPCKTINREIKLAHAGLGITEHDWQVALQHFTETLKGLNIAMSEREELLQIIVPLQRQIVERRGG